MTSKQNDYSHERAAKAGKALMEFDAVAQNWRASTITLVGLSIRVPREDGDDYLMTLRGVNESGGPVVAFHGAYNMLELWISAWGRFSNGTLKWRDDDWER